MWKKNNKLMEEIGEVLTSIGYVVKHGNKDGSLWLEAIFNTEFGEIKVELDQYGRRIDYDSYNIRYTLPTYFYGNYDLHQLGYSGCKSYFSLEEFKRDYSQFCKMENRDKQNENHPVKMPLLIQGNKI